MKRDRIVIVIFFLSSLLIGIAVAYFLPRIINTQKPFINKAAIVKFTSPDAKTSDITEEYHLWLKMELSPAAFDALFAPRLGTEREINPSHQYIGVGVKKDEMRSERLINENVIQDMLVIQGFITEEAITNNTGLPLRINKVIVLAKESIRPLGNEESLSNPQVIPQEQFQPRTDIYQATEEGKTLLYIHLESGIKPRGNSDMLSLTITYLKDNKATQSQTLPLFSY